MFNQLTEKDIQKMEEEIEYRKVVVRKEKLEAVKEARAQGDLSENFEYYAAKKDKNANERRIRYLDMISNVSPMGKALLRHKVGDRVQVMPEKGEPYYVVIREIVNTVDDGTDRIN